MSYKEYLDAPLMASEERKLTRTEYEILEIIGRLTVENLAAPTWDEIYEDAQRRGISREDVVDAIGEQDKWGFKEDV